MVAKVDCLDRSSNLGALVPSMIGKVYSVVLVVFVFSSVLVCVSVAMMKY